MRNHFLYIICLLCFYKVAAQNETLQLSKPYVSYPSIFFRDSMEVKMKFDLIGANIQYYIDNQMYNNKKISAQKHFYRNPIVLKKDVNHIIATSNCDGFLPSEPLEVTFIKAGIPVKKVEGTLPNPKYHGNGIQALTDLKGGDIKISSPDWLGYDQDTLEFEMQLESPSWVQNILFSFLQNEDSWVFLPNKIDVQYFDTEKNQFKDFGSIVQYFDTKGKSQIKFITIKTPQKVQTDRLKITINTLQKIPNWHPAKGNHAWCFLNEIIIK
ncbi:MAG: hypothetical protein IPL95_05280 [Saprospiraceae bacterium]|nr:hypothetical protein [Saprospiraceae bacterium]